MKSEPCVLLCVQEYWLLCWNYVFSSGQTGLQNSTELGGLQVRPRILCYSNPLSSKCTRLIALALPFWKLSFTTLSIWLLLTLPTSAHMWPLWAAPMPEFIAPYSLACLAHNTHYAVWGFPDYWKLTSVILGKNPLSYGYHVLFTLISPAPSKCLARSPCPKHL